MDHFQIEDVAHKPHFDSKHKWKVVFAPVVEVVGVSCSFFMIRLVVVLYTAYVNEFYKF